MTTEMQIETIGEQDVETIGGAPEEAHEGLEAAHIDRRFVIKRDGKDYVLVNGLIDMLHQLSGGCFDIATQVVQVPSPNNGEVAVVTATVRVYDPGSARVLRAASGIGDAGPASVNRMIAPHSLRMAETRAIGRALRLITNIGMTALEELGGPESGAVPAPREHGATAAPFPAQPEGIVVEGKRYTKDQVWGFYQQRVTMARQQGIALPPVLLLERSASPSQIVGATQQIKNRLNGVPAPSGEDVTLSLEDGPPFSDGGGASGGGGGQKTVQQPSAPATPKQLQTIERMARAAGTTVDTAGMNRSQASDAITRLIDQAGPR